MADMEAERPIQEDTDNQLQETFFGLTPRLWRLAIVIGVAQFSWSIWGWQFGIFLQTFLTEQQIGITFSAGTIASLAGLPLSGIIADRFGRRNTLVASFLPIFLGLLLLAVVPVWPLVPLFYGLVGFGWSFVLVIARAVPADQMTITTGKDQATQFTMVLMPAFLVDGLSPIIASMLLLNGLEERYLMLVGALGTVVAAAVSFRYVQETINTKIKEKAREGSLIPVRALGKSYWAFTLSMMCFYFASGLALPYYGNLITTEWHIPVVIFGIAWSAFSLTTAFLMYSVSGLANRNVKAGLIAGLGVHALLIGVSGVAGGVMMLFIINFVWSIPLVLWVGCERYLTVADVPEEMKGRAMGFFSVLMSSTAIFSAPLGAYIWETSGSLRHLYQFTFWFALLMMLPIIVDMALTRIHEPQED